jgi:Subtilase family
MKFAPLACAIALFSMVTARAQEPGVIPGHVLVMLKEHVSPDRVAHDLSALNNAPTSLRVDREVSAPMRIWLLTFDTSIAQDVMLAAVQRHAGVLVAQNDHSIQERIVPNDTQFNQQWHHVDPQDNDIDTDLAWNTTTGGTSANGDAIVVCVVEGFDRSHADLNLNAWVNTAEVDNNGIDDDGNGYVDDVYGWNPSANNDNTLFSGSHGSSCAGMVGARGNNSTGVAGANWNVQMMPVRIGSLTEANVMASYTYPLVQRRRWNSTNGAQGSFVVATTSSWGIDNANPINYPLWCNFYDTLGAAGILSCGATANNNVNVDVVGDMPTACSSPFMISVTATDASDNRTFSGYGLTTIDVGAPGASVRTTASSNGYTTTSGTSFATPLTAGVIALLYSAPCSGLATLARTDPDGAALAVRQALFSGVEQVGNLPGSVATGGRINANNSLQYIITNCASYSPATGVLPRVFLEGPYVEAVNRMRDDLRVAGLVPLTEPYTALGFTNASGGGGETTTPAVLAVTGDRAVVDWVHLELRANTPPYAVVATRNALLSRDGTCLRAADGQEGIYFNIGPGTYRLAVRHRNHLGAMVNQGTSLGPLAVPVDFTDPGTATYGTEAQRTIGSERVLWIRRCTIAVHRQRQ